jgi:hypothetical protein
MGSCHTWRAAAFKDAHAHHHRRLSITSNQVSRLILSRRFVISTNKPGSLPSMTFQMMASSTPK